MKAKDFEKILLQEYADCINEENDKYINTSEIVSICGRQSLIEELLYKHFDFVGNVRKYVMDNIVNKGYFPKPSKDFTEKVMKVINEGEARDDQ